MSSFSTGGRDGVRECDICSGGCRAGPWTPGDGRWALRARLWALGVGLLGSRLWALGFRHYTSWLVLMHAKPVRRSGRRKSPDRARSQWGSARLSDGWTSACSVREPARPERRAADDGVAARVRPPEPGLSRASTQASSGFKRSGPTTGHWPLRSGRWALGARLSARGVGFRRWALGAPRSALGILSLMALSPRSRPRADRAGPDCQSLRSR